MARRVAVGRQADNTAVAEQIVLAIDLDHLVPKIEIGAVEAASGSHVGVHSRFPLALLNHHYRVGDEGVAADMVEVEMRFDEYVDPCRVAADRFEPCADFLARGVVERGEVDGSRSYPRRTVALAMRGHAGAE